MESLCSHCFPMPERFPHWACVDFSCVGLSMEDSIKDFPRMAFPSCLNLSFRILDGAAKWLLFMGKNHMIYILRKNGKWRIYYKKRCFANSTVWSLHTNSQEHDWRDRVKETIEKWCLGRMPSRGLWKAPLIGATKIYHLVDIETPFKNYQYLYHCRF